MFGPIEKYLLDKIETERAIHITLIDPEKITAQQASKVAKNACESGTTAFMIGGSTFVSQAHLDSVIKSIKQTVETPIILFPNNITGISRNADAIWFMSLLNSVDPYFLIGAQILGAPLVKKLGLEPISLGYIIVGEGGTAGIIGKALPIPYNKPELAVAHALAGQYTGMHFINLDVSQLKKMAAVSLFDNQPVWFAADIGKQNDKDNGILADGIYNYGALYGTDIRMSKADRILYRASTPNHAMAFVGIDTLQDGKPVKWLVENSWGSDRGDKGYWTMYDNWFTEYVYTVIIHKKYIPEEILAILDMKPVTLPAWHLEIN